jgi:hypothetical protein
MSPLQIIQLMADPSRKLSVVLALHICFGTSVTMARGGCCNPLESSDYSCGWEFPVVCQTSQHVDIVNTSLYSCHNGQDPVQLMACSKGCAGGNGMHYCLTADLPTDESRIAALKCAGVSGHYQCVTPVQVLAANASNFVTTAHLDCEGENDANIPCAASFSTNKSSIDEDCDSSSCDIARPLMSDLLQKIANQAISKEGVVAALCK